MISSGKVFPKLRRRARAFVSGRHRSFTRSKDEDGIAEGEVEGGGKDEEDGGGGGIETEKRISEGLEDEEAHDFVFRILTSIKPEKMCKYHTFNHKYHNTL